MTDEKPVADEPMSQSTDAAADARAHRPSDSPSTVDRVTVRRSPRYGRFIILGVGLAAIITFILTNLFPIDPAVGFGALFGYFLLFAVPIGAGLGGLIAVLLDVISSRRATQLEAERTTDDPSSEQYEG